MAKWIGEARATKLAEEDEEDNDIPVVNYWVLNWKLTTLTVGQAERPLQLSHVEVDAELELIQALAEVEEDDQLDNGEVAIDLDDEFVG